MKKRRKRPCPVCTGYQRLMRLPERPLCWACGTAQAAWEARQERPGTRIGPGTGPDPTIRP